MHDRPPRYVAGLAQPDRCLVMGVLNVTPDSFSDGGRYLEPSLALKHGRQLVSDGADLVDVGGESTRPGAARPSVQEELDRVMPVVTGLLADGVLVSVDTMRATVAEEAVRAGAVLVNDVSGGRADDELISLTVEEDGEVRRLVRRRATWPGQRVRLEDVSLQDPVVLIEGRLDISFVFARLTPDGALAWYASWAGERTLPRYVRLILRDRATGADLLGEADFLVHANAPAACGRADAALACLSTAPSLQADASEERPVR